MKHNTPKLLVVLVGLSVLACAGPAFNSQSANQPDRRYESGWFVLHVDDMAYRLNSIDDVEISYIITNISQHRVDYFEAEVTPLDREGNPIENAYGQSKESFAVEGDLAAGESGRYTSNFGLWSQPIKTARITLISATLENGEVEVCNPDVQKCSWEVSRD